MKTPVAIALIVAGVVLVITPALSDMVYQGRVAQLIAQPGINQVHLGGQMSGDYRFGCWLTGTVSILLAIRYSIGKRRAEDPDTTSAQPVRV